MSKGCAKKSGRGAWLCLLALALLLPGCFDYEVDLKLKSDGTGEVRTNAAFAAKRQQPGMPPELKILLEPKPEAGEAGQGGRWVMSEHTGFRSLGRLKMKRLRFKVELLDVGLLVVGTPSYRFHAYLMPTGQDQDDRTVGQGNELDDRRPQAKPAGDDLDMKVARLYAKSLGSHYFQLTVELPGKILKARTWVVGSHKIRPRVSAGNTVVSWRIPLAVLVNEDVRGNLLFTADFKGEFVAGSGHAAAQSTMPGDAARAKAKGDLPGKTATGLDGGPGSTPPTTNPTFIGVTPRDKY